MQELSNIRPMSDWQKGMTATVGVNVKRLRGDRSHLWLQNETEKLGFRVSRSGISELETGKRSSISVAEWLILARALEVAPVVLLMPDYPDGETQYLPGHHAHGYEVADWITGQRATNLAPSKNNSAPLETPTQLAALLAKRHEIETRQPGFEEFFERMNQESDEEKRYEMIPELHEINKANTQRIDRIDRDIINLGHYANRARRDETIGERMADPTTDTD